MHPYNFVKLDPGTRHINGTFLGEIKEAHFEPTDEEYELQREIYTLLADTSHGGTMELVASLRRIAFLKLTGEWQWVKDTCPNKRIVYLNAERFFIGDIICVKLYSHDETVIGRLARVGDDCLMMDVSEQYSSIMRQIPHDDVCEVHVWDGKEGEKKKYD